MLPDLFHTGEIVGVHGLLDRRQFEFGKLPELFDRFVRGPCGVGVRAQFDSLADGFAYGFETGRVVGGADFDFDLVMPSRVIRFASAAASAGASAEMTPL